MQFRSPLNPAYRTGEEALSKWQSYQNEIDPGIDALHWRAESFFSITFYLQKQFTFVWDLTMGRSAKIAPSEDGRPFLFSYFYQHSDSTDGRGPKDFCALWENFLRVIKNEMVQKGQ